MSAPEIPPPAQRRYSGRQIAMITVGVILLVPGACAIALALSMIGELRMNDPYTPIILWMWAICFAVSAIGIVLIVVARKRARIAP